MPHRQRHRGRHQQDSRLFRVDNLPVLNQGVSDLSWLLTRNYTEKSALKLVGDRYQLTQRQRKVLARAACTDGQREERLQNAVDPPSVRGQKVFIDGYNLLITIEVALAGGLVLLCRDGCYRDIASVHGTYRRVEETNLAFEIIGDALQALESGPVQWWLDAPVSNSGRLKQMMDTIAGEKGYPWTTELANNPDQKLIETEGIVVSSDGEVIDSISWWFNLAEYVIRKIPQAWIIDVRGN